MTVPQKAATSGLRKPSDPENKVEQLRRTVKKRYRTTIKTKRKFEFPGEEGVVEEMVLVLRLANYNSTQIAMIVGVSRGQVREFIAKPSFQKKYLALKERLPEAAMELGRAYLIEAVQAVAHVMRTANDPKVILQAAGEIMDRFGLAKQSVTKNQQQSPLEGIGRGGNETVFEQFKNAPPEVQEKAAALFDALDEGMRGLLKDSTEEVPNGPN